MSNVFAVVLVHREYGDKSSRVLSVFANEDKANCEIRYLISKIEELRALIVAERAMMNVWLFTHPEPDVSFLSEDGEAWQCMKDNESKRLNDLLGIDAMCKFLNVDDLYDLGFHYHWVEQGCVSVHLSEVPFHP